MVKSMLDLRLLDSYCPDTHEEQQEQMKTHPLNISTCQRGRGPSIEAGLRRTNQELGSTVSLQVTSAWVRKQTVQLEL